MALKQTLQKVTTDDILFRAKNAAAAGTLMTYVVDGTGDGYVQKVSGSPVADLDKVAGVLLINVEDRAIPSNLTLIGDDTGTVDLPRNFNRNVTYTSGVVRLLRIGTCETDQVDATAEFGQGSGVYLGANGLFTVASGTGATERVGTALTGKRDGFVRVFVNIN
jgi:hypothetical protein